MVQFFPNVRVCPVVHLNDMSLEEISNTWYEREDFARFKQEGTKIQTLVEKVSATTQLLCVRGSRRLFIQIGALCVKSKDESQLVAF